MLCSIVLLCNSVYLVMYTFTVLYCTKPYCIVLCRHFYTGAGRMVGEEVAKWAMESYEKINNSINSGSAEISSDESLYDYYWKKVQEFINEIKKSKLKD